MKVSSRSKTSPKSLRSLISEMVREELGPKVVTNVRELKSALSGMDDRMDLVISLMYKGSTIIVRDIEVEVTGDEEREVTIGGRVEDWD